MSKDKIIIYTDGGALKNPGPGGYGAVIAYQGHHKEIRGGFRLTTNNRMELMACIQALKALKTYKDGVVLYCDSKYVVDAINKGWVFNWCSHGWIKSDRQPAKNIDLWKVLLELINDRVEFKWVKGHAGIKGNERCDAIVREESAKLDLPPDIVYENTN